MFDTYISNHEERNKQIVKLIMMFLFQCDQYWPNRSTETYGVMYVSFADIQELASYCIRTFYLQRVIMDLHYY